MTLKEALTNSGLIITIERHFFIVGWEARLKGLESPPEGTKDWHNEYILMGWEAANDNTGN